MNKMMMIVSLVMGFNAQTVAQTLATVNGKAVTQNDYDALIANLPDQQKVILKSNAVAKNQLVQNLIEQELMLQEAGKLKLEDSVEFKNALSVFRKQALSNLLVKTKLASQVSQKSVKDYFEKNKYKYNGDEVKAQHVLVSTESEAKEILALAKKGGDFLKLAESRSKDPSAKNNRGDLGYFGRDTFEQTFTEAAFTTKVGEIVGPIKTTFGYHVIKVVDRKAGKSPEFAEVEDRVRADLQASLLRDYLAGLKSKAKIKLAP